MASVCLDGPRTLMLKELFTVYLKIKFNSVLNLRGQPDLRDSEACD